MAEEEQRQIEKVKFTFLVSIEWIIEKEKHSFNFVVQEISTKTYTIPGFEWFCYFILLETKLQPKKFCINFERNWLEEKTCEWESNLHLTINNGEPKKVSKKFKDDELLLHEGPIEELINSEKCSSIPITLQIKGSITVHEISRPEDYYAYIPLSLLKFRGFKEPKDFIIEVEKQEIQVHKKLLQFYSPVFCAMFENGWKEAIEGRVVIPEFSFKIVKTAVDLYYGEDNKSYYETPELILLYHFADKYDMDEIKHAIKKIIMLTPNNICEYANLFHAENCPVFVNHCIDRLIVYFQFSYPVKDLETLNNDIKNQFFYQASVSKAMKKEFNPDYHKNLNDEEEEEALPLL